MTQACYLDACSVLCWARTETGDYTTFDAATSTHVKALINRRAGLTSLSEITLIEVYDKLAHWCRGGEEGASRTWLLRMESEIMGWLADERVLVLPLPPKIFERSMGYLRRAGEVERRKLRTMDAAHLVHAVHWARILDQRVDLVSSDHDFAKIINKWTGFQEFIVQVDPSTGLDLTPRN